MSQKPSRNFLVWLVEKSARHTLAKLSLAYAGFFTGITWFTGLELTPPQFDSWPWWKLLLETAGISALLYVVLMLICLVIIFRTILSQPYQLLKQHHILLEADRPSLLSAFDLWDCLNMSGFKLDEVLVAARLHIEYAIWSPEKQIEERKFIDDYLKHVPSINRNEDHSHDEVKVQNCFVLQKNRELIEGYFQALAGLPEPPADKDQFLTEAIIEDGFVAPQYLLAGLMSEFEEDWGPVIREFHKELNQGAGRRFLNCATKRIQLFTFDCWLLWGPSIPIGSCSNWYGERDQSIVALQYGFGDENNSLPLLPLVGKDVNDYAALFKTVASQPLALKKSVKVRPVWIYPPARGSAQAGNHLVNEPQILGELKKIGPAQRSIREPRISNSERKGMLVLDYAGVIGGDPLSKTLPSDYYSAYVWVMFVICLRRKTADGVQIEPIYQTKSNQASVKPTPWLGIIPFFEHGNIADQDAFAANKSQLAHKCLATMERLARESLVLDGHPVDWSQLVFQYACASDDPNCPDCRHHDRELGLKPTTPERGRIRDLLESLLGIATAQGSPPSPETGRFQTLQPLVKLDVKDWTDEQQRAFSACHLPDIVDQFYDHCSEEKSS